MAKVHERIQVNIEVTLVMTEAEARALHEMGAFRTELLKQLAVMSPSFARDHGAAMEDLLHTAHNSLGGLLARAQRTRNAAAGIKEALA